MPKVPISGIEPRMRAGIRIERDSRSHYECRVQALHRNHVPRLFHIYVMPYCRGKRILELDLPV